MLRNLVTILLVIIAQYASAYPITPQTLRKLIERSEFIVIATIDNPHINTKIYDDNSKDSVEILSFGGDGIADLYIIEVLKGKLKNTKHLQVGYEGNMICPAPAHYPDKKTVIAFLDKEDTSKFYYTVGLSYGSKIIDNEIELLSYKTRIIEYLDITKIRNKQKRETATVEWLVKCAEDRYTRWEGAYELSRKGNFMYKYDNSMDEQFFKNLSTSQLHRLDSVFFLTDTIGYNELCLANLISKDNYSRLKNHLIKGLSTADYYIVPKIMKKVIEIYPNDELQTILDETDDLDYDDKEKEIKQKKLIDKFIAFATM